jgi:hypothetical protein
MAIYPICNDKTENIYLSTNVLCTRTYIQTAFCIQLYNKKYKNKAIAVTCCGGLLYNIIGKLISLIFKIGEPRLNLNKNCALLSYFYSIIWIEIINGTTCHLNNINKESSAKYNKLCTRSNPTEVPRYR